MNNSQIAVIIPAYNENKNLSILLREIEKYLPGALVIVVDDSCPKDAKAVLTLIHRDFCSVILISRQSKQGRGSAVLRGLLEALKHKEIRYCFEMDADLAHAPAEFRNFLYIRDTADLVIGSRYMRESNIVTWPLRRRIQSKVINAALNIWFGLHITDYTNGFRLYSRKAAEYLLKAHLQETGFIALSEMAYQLKRHGFRISEVPISFRDRTCGTSNANLKEFFRSLIGAIRIRFRSI